MYNMTRLHRVRLVYRVYVFSIADRSVVVVGREYLEVLIRIPVARRIQCAMPRPFFEDDVAASNNRTGIPVVEFIPVAPIIADQAIFN